MEISLRNFLKIFLAVIIMIILMVVYRSVLNYKRTSEEEKIKNEKIKSMFTLVENKKYATISEYTIYGNHLNIKGTIDQIEDENVEELELVIMDLDQNESKYNLKYSINEGNIEFYLSQNINEGIDLEKISSGDYYLYIKLKNSQKTYYYSLKNDTKYNGNEYYTLTNENKNRKISIDFLEYNNKIPYMKINSSDIDLPNNVYDIVIDAGHGGRDPGAMYENNTEAECTLEYAYSLKSRLESIGYKVKLTREKDEYVDTYGKGGRAIVPYEVKAKLFISLHLNSTAISNPEGGIEIYCANNMNTALAKSFADNIVNIAKTKYSPNNQFRVLDGVYIRTYTQDEVEEAIEYANDVGYTPYENLSTQTPYYFMIRETGGIMTRAYIDGRNKNLKDNPYSSSNISAESYLLELGFINSKDDLENLQKNKEAYIEAIVKTIVDNYKNN